MMGAPHPQQEVSTTTAAPAATIKTLVVTDLVGSTRLFATLGDRRAAELSARHERIARDLLQRCGGREIDKTDGFLLLFDRTIDAVRFALTYHRKLAELSQDEGEEVAARVGIHLGEVILRANRPEDVARGAKPVEIEGYAKPIAARVMTLAEGRQTLLTRGAFDLARHAATRETVAPGELRWLAHGPYVLKGVTEPVEIFEVGEEDIAPLLVPKSTAKARRAVSADEELTLGWRPAPGLEVPRRPRWRLVEKLGEGGFGEVWRAAHEKIGENRVFKFCYQSERLRSLQREVTLFRLLRETLGSRDDIARILDWNFDEAPYFLECEYTEGGNLAEWVQEQGGPAEVPIATRLELMAQVAEALAAAHSVGVLHKDVKPSNVLVRTDKDGRPRVRLTDFGIGLITDRDALARQGITVFDLTEMVTETSGGTHLYMAPELVEGRNPTVQADIYALGVMLYQFLAGDFSHALAPGWRRDVPDEVLQEDVAALVDGRADRRMRDAQQVAQRLRTVDARREQREAERRERAEREAERAALERAHRRRRLSAAVTAVSLVVLAVVSFLALKAVEARREAESRRGQAESLIGFMVGDLREKLEPIGRLDVLDEVGTAALEYFNSVPEEDLTDEEVLRRSQALYQLGEVHMSSGDLEAALDAFSEARRFAESLTGRQPESTAAWKELGAAHFGIGYVHLRQRLLDRSLESFEAYLEIARRLAATEPDEPEWRLETAYALSNVGSVFEAQGNLSEAREALEESLSIRRQLLREDPPSSGLRRGLAVAHNKLGVVLDALGRPEDALRHFRADLDLSQDLVTGDRSDSDLLERLATARSYLGFELAAIGRDSEALEQYDHAAELFRELTLRDERNLQWQRSHAVVGRHRGLLLAKLGEIGRGLDVLETSVASLERLVEENPTDSGWRRDLAYLRLTLAEVLLWADRPYEARDSARRSVSRLEAILKASPDSAQAASRLSTAHEVLGRIYQRLGAPEAASEQWSRAITVLAPFGDRHQDREVLAARALALARVGRVEEAGDIARRLEEMGYSYPDLEALSAEPGAASAS